MDPFDDNHISKPSDNFTYKDEVEKNELEDSLFSARLSLELKCLLIMFSLGVVLGAGALIYSHLHK